MSNWWNNRWWGKKEKQEKKPMTYEEHLRKAGMSPDEVDKYGRKKGVYIDAGKKRKKGK